MGKRGPAPTPTALKRLSGSWRADLNPLEPQPPEDVPIVAPEWIRERAKEFWDNLIPILDFMGVVTCADADALALYCQSLAKLEEYELFIAENGSTYTTYNSMGEISAIRPYPQATMAKEMTAMVSRLGQQFGLTPSSRAHLEVNDPSKALKTDKNQFFRSTTSKTA